MERNWNGEAGKGGKSIARLSTRIAQQRRFRDWWARTGRLGTASQARCRGFESHRPLRLYSAESRLSKGIAVPVAVIPSSVGIRSKPLRAGIDWPATGPQETLRMQKFAAVVSARPKLSTFADPCRAIGRGSTPIVSLVTVSQDVGVVAGSTYSAVGASAPAHANSRLRGRLKPACPTRRLATRSAR